MNDTSNNPVELGSDENAAIVEKKATCPFIGSVVAQGLLAVRNNPMDPLASIEEVRRLGNTGGGDLGDLLVFFASGNHNLMRDMSGKLKKQVPDGLFSLDFPGSQGSHPGHSRILQGDPGKIDSGRLSREDFERLTRRGDAEGLIKRSEVGRFIAENLIRDHPNSKVLGKETVVFLASDFGDLAGAVGSIRKSLLNKVIGSDENDNKATFRNLESKLTKLLGEDNLVGSSGEFGLLFAFLANSPHTKEVDSEPAISIQDLKNMFVDKRLPDGWESWKKTRVDWVMNTIGLMISADKEYRDLKPT